jgi:trehalose 6-phosphate synthase
MWTKEQLRELVRNRLSEHLFLVVSNREPYIHTFSGEEVECIMPASGLTMALDPVMRACGGIWVAHGSGDADKQVVDANDRVMVPPEAPEYTLRRVWLSKEQEQGFYYGFSNEALWPLCHIAFTSPVFDESHWNTYQQVNQLFAETVLKEVGDNHAIVFIQDYHFALLSRLIKEQKPDIITAQFWHIPWPTHEVFRVCPWHEEILDGLLGNDLLGFHIQYHCNNFMETVDRALECRIDRENFAVIRGGKTTVVRPFPISVDFERIAAESSSPAVDREIERLKHELGLRGKYIGVGMDRLDYTKGIPERLRALDRFFVKYPEYQGKVVFLELGIPSRIRIGQYWELNERIDRLVDEINWKYEWGSWKPVIYLKGHASPLTLSAVRRMAHFCVVSSLHDGMNLVAKEFVAARCDEEGVLILSRFTGASRELVDAVLINPYATDSFAEAIRQAIEMPPEESQSRMRRMREVVRDNNIYDWGASVILELLKLQC